MNFKYRNDEINNATYRLMKKERRLARRSSQERLNKILPLQIANSITKTVYLLSDEDAELAFRYPTEFTPFKKRTL